MSIVLPGLGVAFAAFCSWLAVRIVNRRERWAKWTAVGLVVLLAYPLSLGPASWLLGQDLLSWKTFRFAYRPIVSLDLRRYSRDPLLHYAAWCGGDDARFAILDNLVRDELQAADDARNWVGLPPPDWNR